MCKYFLVVILVFINVFCFAQELSLAPSITKTHSQPADNAIISKKKAKVKNHENDFSGGFKEGKTMPDFTLYTADGKELTLSKVLKETKKPVLLVSGSCTCPIFRSNITLLNSMVAEYDGRLNIYVVYTMEAHPEKGNEPYVNVPYAKKLNEKENIHISQATTYLERRKAVDTLNKYFHVDAKILLDDPNNDWWSNSGCTANNAYLVDTTGLIVAKNPWFNATLKPGSMWCYIDRLLGITPARCSKLDTL